MQRHTDTLSETHIRGLLRREAPEVAELPISPGAGWGTDTAIFRLGHDLILRVAQSSGATALLEEAGWLRQVSGKLPLEIPGVVASGPASDEVPFPWAIYTWVAGTDLDAAPLNDGAAAHALAAFVRTLHGLPCPPDAPRGRRGGPLTDRAAEFHAALKRCDGLLDTDAAGGLWDDACAAPAHDGAPVWLHADLIPANLIQRDGRLTGVIDFGLVTTGDPSYDMIPAWFLFDPPERTTFLEALGADGPARRRARGLVLSQSVIALPYYLDTNPAMVRLARRGIAATLAEAGA